MPTVEVSLPEDVLSQLERLADEEFINEDEAVEELLTAGLDAYRTPGEDSTEEDLAEEYAGDMWDTAEESMETGETDDYL